MATKEVLQRGTVPTVNSKGQRVAERPFNDSDTQRVARGSRTLGDGMAGAAEAQLSGRGQQIDSIVDGAVSGKGHTYSPYHSTDPKGGRNTGD